MKSFLFFMFTLVLSTTALALPTHMVNCRIEDQTKKTALFLEIENSELSRGIGTITLANLQEPSGQLKWVPFQKAQTMVKVQWVYNPFYRNNSISAAQIAMGRTGEISIITNNRPDQHNSYVSVIRSTVLGFYYPGGVRASCYYFLATGVKPGMTGSN